MLVYYLFRDRPDRDDLPEAYPYGDGVRLFLGGKVVMAMNEWSEGENLNRGNPLLKHWFCVE